MVNPSLNRQFEVFDKIEEEHWRGNLERIKYTVDVIDTLGLVTGRGRIERVSLSSCIMDFKNLLNLSVVSFTVIVHSSSETLRNHQALS